MIEQAAILLAKKGLQGASFRDVLAASGGPRGSLYHHFPGGKDELVLAALAVAEERAMQMFDAATGKSAIEVAAAFIDLWRAILVKSGFSAGCAVVAVTVAADAPALLESAANVFRAWRARLAALLAAGGVPPDRAGALATTLISACEGAVILSRAEKSLEPFELVVTEQLAAMEAAVAAGRRKAREGGSPSRRV
jgi:AcrR family transcriptional regulator